MDITDNARKIGMAMQHWGDAASPRSYRCFRLWNISTLKTARPIIITMSGRRGISMSGLICKDGLSKMGYPCFVDRLPLTCY